MQLSYAGRLICLALCSAGTLQLVLECLAWMLAPSLGKLGRQTNARRTERSLLTLTLLARLGPWLVVLGAWLPAYMRDEDNLSPEHVGFVPIAAAFCVFALWLAGFIRLLHASILAQRLCRRCSPAGASPEGLPLLLYPGPQPLLAVAGMFRPHIIVSESLLEPGRISPAALEVALLHESAHARHHDNLKQAILWLLPHVSFATSARPSLDQHWRLAAEMAADEDGAMGIPERSILLADLLVKMARENMPAVLHGAFALLSRADDLRVRIERLLPAKPSLSHGSVSTPTRFARLQTPAVLAIACVALASFCYLGMQAGHQLSELLLHIG